MDWFTSDLHLNHDKDFLWQPRGFSNVYDMSETLVTNINRTIKPTDNLYILGDIMLGDNTIALKYFHQIHGNKFIICGNHDTATRIKLYEESANTTILGLAAIYRYGNYKFYLSHYSTATSNFDNDKPLKARILNLCGHTHQKELWDKTVQFSYHVEMDAHDNFPVSIEQIIEDFKQQQDASAKRRFAISPSEPSFR